MAFLVYCCLKPAQKRTARFSAAVRSVLRSFAGLAFRPDLDAKLPSFTRAANDARARVSLLETQSREFEKNLRG